MVRCATKTFRCGGNRADNMKKQDLENLGFKLNQHYAEQGKLRKELCEAVYELLDALGGEMRLHEGALEDDYLYIAYDGGNHVEYASNMCSEVHCVNTLEDCNGKSFTVDCDDESDLEAYRLTFDDVSAVFDLVKSYYEWTLAQKVGDGMDYDDPDEYDTADTFDEDNE